MTVNVRISFSFYDYYYDYFYDGWIAWLDVVYDDVVDDESSAAVSRMAAAVFNVAFCWLGLLFLLSQIPSSQPAITRVRLQFRYNILQPFKRLWYLLLNFLFCFGGLFEQFLLSKITLVSIRIGKQKKSLTHTTWTNNTFVLNQNIE